MIHQPKGPKSHSLRVSRRSIAAAIPGLIFALPLQAQPSGLRLRKLNCFEIRVTDLGRSIEFYQALFGLPVQARYDDRVCLRVGDGPQFMAVREIEAGESPGITHLGYSVEDFDVTEALASLRRIGIERIDAPPRSEPGISNRMTSWTRRRGETTELYFADDRGLIVQLSHPDYCGGGGANGERCDNVEPVAAGPLQLSELNHFTVFLNDGAEANRFYQQTFGLEVQAYQGPQSPVTGIGDGHQFVMYAGGRRETPTPANIHHGSFNMPDFDLERVRSALTEFGLTAQEGAGTDPLIHYVSLRMPNRGGAEGGTPELYFTDPDGILLQMQDLSYCGGGGYFGNECLSG